jgi:hypothetical protein
MKKVGLHDGPSSWENWAPAARKRTVGVLAWLSATLPADQSGEQAEISAVRGSNIFVFAGLTLD